jgi:hypothetical protein
MIMLVVMAMGMPMVIVLVRMFDNFRMPGMVMTAAGRRFSGVRVGSFPGRHGSAPVHSEAA